MALSYSKLGAYFTRTPASGAFTGATDQKSGQAFNAASGTGLNGDSITRASATPTALSGSWSFQPLSYLTFLAEFVIDTLPADGEVVGIFNSGGTGYYDPERSVLLERSGSSYYIRTVLGQGNGGLAARFLLPSAPATGSTLRLAVAFPAAGANAGVAFSADQSAYLIGAALTMSGGISNLAPNSAGFFDVTQSGDDGLTDRICFTAGLYGTLLQGRVLGAGWGWVGTNGLVSGDISDYITNGAGASAPNPPSGVSVSSVGPYSATASWTDNSTDETGFKVQVAASPYSTWTSVGTTAANATSQAVTGLTDGTAYKVRVASTNANGDSAWVESGIFTTTALTKLRPSATTSAGAWTAVGAASLHAAINETPASDAEYATTSAASTMKVKIANASSPGTTANHSFQYRCKGDGVSQLKVDLVQGDPSETLIKTVTITPTTSFATYTVSLTTGEAGTITDYTALYFKFTSL